MSVRDMEELKRLHTEIGVVLKKMELGPDVDWHREALQYRQVMEWIRDHGRDVHINTILSVVESTLELS